MHPPRYNNQNVPSTPTTIVIQTAAPGIKVYHAFHCRQSRLLGAGQACIGLASILCWSLAIYIDKLGENNVPSLSLTGTGVWSGMFFLLPGAFGMAASNMKTFIPIVSFMVLSIVAVVLFDLWYVGWSIALVILNFPLLDQCGEEDKSDLCQLHVALVVTLMTSAILSATYLFLAIWSIIICSMAICCSTPSEAASVKYIPGSTEDVGYRVSQSQMDSRADPPPAYHIGEGTKL